MYTVQCRRPTCISQQYFLLIQSVAVRSDRLSRLLKLICGLARKLLDVRIVERCGHS